MFDLPRLQPEINRLEQLTAAPGFWAQQEKARPVTRKRAGIQQQVADIEKLTRDVEDAAVLLELGASERDESVVAEAEAQLPALESRVRAAELARMLSGPVDHA